MIFGIVASYNKNKPAGFERTTLGILKSVLEADKENYFIIYTKKGSGLKQLLADFSRARVVESTFGPVWKDIGLFFARRSDIYIFVGQQVPFLFAPKKYAVVVYDFAYHCLPASTLAGKLTRVVIDWLTRISFKRAQKVIGISQATIDDAVLLYGLDPKKGAVMYPGFFDVSQAMSERMAIPEKYFLCIGTVKKRKNTLRVIAAFAAFQKKHPEFTLVIAGKYNKENDYVKKMFEFIHQHNLSNNVIILGHVSDGQVAYLYQNAFALVFPSLLEGFGYPILEAMSGGVPVITSNSSSLVEVAGKAAILVNPESIAEIELAMNKLVEDSYFREEITKKGKERVKLFSWERTGRTFLEIVKNL